MKIHLKTPKKSDVENKTVLVRVAYDVPLEYLSNGEIKVEDDSRIRDSLETIKFLQEANSKIVLIAHLGRPKYSSNESGEKEVLEDSKNKLSLRPIADHLQTLVDTKVHFLTTSVGLEAKGIIQNATNGEIVLLENIRFHPEEKGPLTSKKSQNLANELAELGEVYINEAFSVSHREHVSMVSLAKKLPAFAGFSLEKEVEFLQKLTDNPQRPFAIVIGGAKISDKVEAIENLSNIADIALIGGGVANNFLKAEGIEIHKSYLQDTPADLSKEKINYVQVADHILEEHRQEKLLKDGYIPIPKILYPTDVVAAPTSVMNTENKQSIQTTTKNNNITVQNTTQNDPNKDTEILDLNHDVRDTENDRDIMYLDIGPKTAQLYSEILSEAKTIFWNGPMGVFEKPKFSKGTESIAQAIAEAKKNGATVVLGGGDTIAAIDELGIPKDAYSYVSTAGGASLDFLAGKELVGLKGIMQKTESE